MSVKRYSFFIFDAIIIIKLDFFLYTRYQCATRFFFICFAVVVFSYRCSFCSYFSSLLMTLLLLLRLLATSVIAMAAGHNISILTRSVEFRSEQFLLSSFLGGAFCVCNSFNDHVNLFICKQTKPKEIGIRKIVCFFFDSVLCFVNLIEMKFIYHIGKKRGKELKE